VRSFATLLNHRQNQPRGPRKVKSSTGEHFIVLDHVRAVAAFIWHEPLTYSSTRLTCTAVRGCNMALVELLNRGNQ
jgi:hypothetical protein